MRIVRSVFLFYRKLIIPSLVLSILIGMMKVINSDIKSSIGFAYIFIPLLFHYYIYEKRNKNEYYFYYNVGLSKIALWVSTFVISLFIGLIIMMI